MIKYTTTQVTFREIPDEVSLCINISGCPIHCPDCHSKYLWEDVGSYLYKDTLLRLIDENKGITCVCFMGGDADQWELRELFFLIREIYGDDLKIAWYSGQDVLHPVMMAELDYYKYGSYKKECGGLDSKTTNQIMYQIDRKHGIARNITYKFWKNDTDISKDRISVEQE